MDQFAFYTGCHWGFRNWAGLPVLASLQCLAYSTDVTNGGPHTIMTKPKSVLSQKDWPDIFSDLDRVLDLQEDNVPVYERLQDYPDARKRTRILCAGLLPEGAMGRMPKGDALGFEVRSNCPSEGLASPDEPFEPHFGIWCIDPSISQIEPMAISWNSFGYVTVVPHPNLLATYGLRTRLFKGESRQLWDDQERQNLRVVDCIPNCKDDSHEPWHSFVRVSSGYIQDYASLRNRPISVGFVETQIHKGDHLIGELLDGEGQKEIKYENSTLRITRVANGSGSRLYVEIRGWRYLATPGGYPVSEDELGELDWPGYGVVASRPRRWRDPMAFVYVRDSVLDNFQEEDDYQVNPEVGYVSLDGLWDTSHCCRVGRDMIQIELRKLYEGAPNWVIRHYHKHAIPTPKDRPVSFSKRTDVGAETTRLATAVGGMNDLLGRLGSQVLDAQIKQEDLGLADSGSIRFNGWWNHELFRQVGKSIPRSMPKAEFLDRATDLFKVVLEDLKDRRMKGMLSRIGWSKDALQGTGKSGRFLMLAASCRAASEEGGTVLAVRGRNPPATEEEICSEDFAALRHVSNLRNSDGHRVKPEHISAALEFLGIDEAETADGWGMAYEVLLKRVREAIEAVSRALEVQLAVMDESATTAG